KRAKRVFDTVSPSHASPFHYLHISPAGELVVSDNYRLLRARIDSGAFADDNPLTLVLHRVIVNDMIALLRGAKKGTVTFARSAEAVVVSGSDKAGTPWRIVAERNQAYRYLDISSFDRGFEPVALHVPVEQFLSSARSAALANEPKNPYITLTFSAAKKLIVMASDSGVGRVDMPANVLRNAGGRVNHTFFDVLDGIAEIDIFIRPTAHACFQCVGVAGALKLKYLVM
ncbi:MAG: hypothetical protein NZQ09_16980, partial [Chloroflexus sp.]|nr:hypothetical protein [Chloroflexus sp.]